MQGSAQCLDTLPEIHSQMTANPSILYVTVCTKPVSEKFIFFDTHRLCHRDRAKCQVKDLATLNHKCKREKSYCLGVNEL